MSFEENLRRIREEMASACARSGRAAGDVQLVAVTKTFPAEAIISALSAGIGDIAESRVQEAQEKFSMLAGQLNAVRKHLIGHLQTNKAKKAVELFDIVQSLDSMRLAGDLDRHARERGKMLDCLLEIKVSPEATKYGLDPGEVEKFIEEARSLTHLRLAGLMAMAPYFDDAGQARPYFERARRVFERVRDVSGLHGFNTLSMGMSGDFAVAIEEGATMVRIGSALFGERSAGKDRE